MAAISEIEANLDLTPDKMARRHSSYLKWNDELKGNLRRRAKTGYDDAYIRRVAYRPFVATNCYANYIFITRKYQMDSIFPDHSSENRVICVPGIGTTKPFSALMTDVMPGPEH